MSHCLDSPSVVSAIRPSPSGSKMSRRIPLDAMGILGSRFPVCWFQIRTEPSAIPTSTVPSDSLNSALLVDRWIDPHGRSCIPSPDLRSTKRKPAVRRRSSGERLQLVVGDEYLLAVATQNRKAVRDETTHNFAGCNFPDEHFRPCSKLWFPP